jgi:uncharacterized membrane protein YdcZ (DUF606 family)
VLRQMNRWLWLVGLVAVTFLFLHTLVNPRGELAEAFREGNVLVFLAAVVSFVAFVFLLRRALWVRARRRRTASS